MTAFVLWFNVNWSLGGAFHGAVRLLPMGNVGRCPTKKGALDVYEVDGNDRVHRLDRVPQSDIGAPQPIVLAEQHHVALGYFVADAGAPRSGTQIIDSNATGDAVALIVFQRCVAHYVGPPNDEAMEGHPLASRGLEPYGAFEVLRSSWMNLLRRRNAVHQHHTPAWLVDHRHFIWTFHDSIFECIATSYTVSIIVCNEQDAMQAIARALSNVD